jgi:hypothetical protein
MIDKEAIRRATRAELLRSIRDKFVDMTDRQLREVNDLADMVQRGRAVHTPRPIEKRVPR